jgi:osmotically-inducible protein OsmY
MKIAAWNVVPLLALLTFAAAPVFARPAPQTVAAKTQKAADKTKDAVVKGSTIGADKTRDGLSKTGEVITDEWITTRAHARFVSENLLKDSDISVDSSKHVVTLTGTVTGRADVQRRGRSRRTQKACTGSSIG